MTNYKKFLRNKKSITVLAEKGPPCPRCKQLLQIRKHSSLTEKQKKQPYYYSRWYNCLNPECRTSLVMPKEFIVYNKPEKQEKRINKEFYI